MDLIDVSLLVPLPTMRLFTDGGVLRLKRCPKLFYRETSIPCDPTHGIRVDRVITWNRQKPNAIRHHDMLTMTDNAKSRFLQGSHGSKMIDAGDAWHA